MNPVFRASIKYLKKADLFLLAFSLICSIIGLVLIWSATQQRTSPDIAVQTLALVLGLICFVAFSLFDVEVLGHRWKLLLVFNIIILLSLVFFGEGDAVGSRNWLRFFGIGIQPSEIVKISFIIMMAYHVNYLKEYKNINSFSSLVQIALHFSYLAFLLPDLGNALIFIFILLVMLFLAGLKLRWFVLGFALIAALAPFLWSQMAGYQQQRILAPFDPSIDPTNRGINFQVHRSRIAIASGQLSGQGLGQGLQTQSGSVPEQHTDFIFSAVGEQFGFIGVIILMILIAIVIIRCFYIATKARNTLQGLVAAGVGAFMLFQTLINIGMNIGLMPVIGIALPFFGYGGSSLVTTFMGMGLVCGVKMRATSPWKRSL